MGGLPSTARPSPSRSPISYLSDFEIDLIEAEELLEEAAQSALSTPPAQRRTACALPSTSARAGRAIRLRAIRTLQSPDLEALAEVIPNNDEPRAKWIKVGLAFFAASPRVLSGRLQRLGPLVA